MGPNLNKRSNRLLTPGELHRLEYTIRYGEVSDESIARRFRIRESIVTTLRRKLNAQEEKEGSFNTSVSES